VIESCRDHYLYGVTSIHCLIAFGHFGEVDSLPAYARRIYVHAFADSSPLSGL